MPKCENNIPPMQDVFKCSPVYPTSQRVIHVDDDYLDNMDIVVHCSAEGKTINYEELKNLLPKEGIRDLVIKCLNSYQ